MIVAFDVDDVVANTNAVVLANYNHAAGTSHSMDEIVSWETDFREDGCGVTLKNFYNDSELYLHVRPVEGALDAVRDVRRLGHRVIFATACMPMTRGRKQDWLHEHGFLGEDIRKDWWMDYMEVADKSLVRAGVLIDDGYHNILGFDGLGILWDKPWNRSAHPNHRACNWDNVMRYIRGLR